MIVAIKTDSMVAELNIVDGNGTTLATDSWEAGRSLSKDLLRHIDILVSSHGKWEELSGLIVFKGPGSFTSLRIGITTANTISYAKQVPIVGQNGDEWLQAGISRLSEQKNDGMVLPEYGADPHITAQKK